MAKKRKVELESPGEMPSNTTVVKDEQHPDESSSFNDDADGDPEKQPVRSLLEPLSKDQLLDLLSSAALAHPDVMSHVRRVADQDPAHRKVFVHGLAWETEADTIASAFRQYGDIEDCHAVRDKFTGKSKGYGFVLFKDRSSARRAVVEPQKLIGGRMTMCQMATIGPVPTAVSEYTQRKIFVSNVSADLDPLKLLEYFSKFGEVEEGPMGLDKQTGRPKGFVLFTYKSIDSARKALEEPHKSFQGRILYCQKAIDGPKPGKAGSGIAQQQTVPLHEPSADLGASGERLGYHGGVVGAQAMSPGTGMGRRTGHLNAPVEPGLGYNQLLPLEPGRAYNQAPQFAAAATPGVNPGFEQALTALITASAAGLGLTNLLGSLASPGMVGQVGNLSAQVAPAAAALALTKLLGSIGSSGSVGQAVNQAVPGQIVNSGGQGMHGGYGGQSVGGVPHGNLGASGGGYGGQAVMQGGYNNMTMRPGVGGPGGHPNRLDGIPHYMLP